MQWLKSGSQCSTVRLVHVGHAKSLILIAALLSGGPLAAAETQDTSATAGVLETTDVEQVDTAPAAKPEDPPIPMEAPVPADTEVTAAAIDAAYNRFLRLRDEDRDAEATAAARQVVQLARAYYGAGKIAIATPLINLAVMQSHNGDLVAAEQNYRAAISIIERWEGMLSARLINPLSGLGHTYNRAGMYEEAVESFNRALRLNNIELGFTNLEQFGIQDGLTESYVGMREFEDANFYQEAQLEIYQRKYGRESPEVVPAMYKLAEWYNRSGNFEQSALTYRSADRILRQAQGEASQERTDGLMGLARLYEQQGNSPAAASALRKAVKVVDSNPEPDRLRRARVLVALGDLYTRDSRPGSAREQYVAAWEDLSSDADYLETRDKYFGLPVRLAGGPFSTLTTNARGKPEAALRDGYAEIRYSIDAEGQAQNMAVIESEPPGLIDDSLLLTYQRSSYRPRFANGAPVATENLLSRHEFKYAGTTPSSQSDQGELARPETNRGRLERPDN